MGKRHLGSIMFFTLCLSIALLLGGQNWTAAAEKPIVFGGSLPQTGKFAETAKWIEKGMKFWGEEINAKGGLLGRKVVFKIYDDESSAGKAVTFAEKAITVDKVDLLFGGYPGTAARAVMPVAEKHKYVYVLGVDKKETRELRREFLERNKVYPYPTERGV